MKICIVGCGAIGGLLASHLAGTQADINITLVERDRQFLALKKQGLILQTADRKQKIFSNFTVVENMRGCGVFDIVFLAVKAHEITSLAEELTTVLGKHTTLVTLQNGIPWWYFQRHGGTLDGKILTSADPTGTLSALIDPDRIIGCVAYPAAEVTKPGVIQHIEGTRFPLGELDGTITERAENISNLLIGAGLKSPILTDIRSEIWLKTWGNLAFNPISALTHATMSDIALYPKSREYTIELMSEAQFVANRLGIEFRVPMERRLKGAEQVGAHKTSMLQDVLARRPMELDAILGTVIEIADLVNVQVPNMKGLYALCSLRNARNLESPDSAISND